MAVTLNNIIINASGFDKAEVENDNFILHVIYEN